MIGGVVILAVRHQDAILNGAGLPQPVLHRFYTSLRPGNGDPHHAQLPGFPEHTADKRAGDAQLCGNITLFPVFQIVLLCHIGELLEFILAGSHCCTYLMLHW